MLPDQLAYVGAAVNSIGGIIYLVATIRGKVQPNRVTFFLWAFAALIAFAAQLHQGIGAQAFLSFSTGFGPVLIFAASFINKKSVWRLTRLDYICGALSLCGIVLWTITQVGNIAILFSILADGLAALPTIVKSYKAPETENRTSYFLSGTGGLLTVLTIKNWNFATYGFPIYTMLINLFIYFVLQMRNRKRFLK